MADIETHVLSEAAIMRLRPLVQELADQEKAAQRMKLITQLLHDQIRQIAAQDAAITLSPAIDIQLDIGRGIIRVQNQVYQVEEG